MEVTYLALGIGLGYLLAWWGVYEKSKTSERMGKYYFDSLERWTAERNTLVNRIVAKNTAEFVALESVPRNGGQTPMQETSPLTDEQMWILEQRKKKQAEGDLPNAFDQTENYPGLM